MIRDCRNCFYELTADRDDPCGNCHCFDKWAEKQSHTSDPVNSPSHYTQGGIECIDAIDSAISDLVGADAFYTAQVIKYIWRWKHKNGVQDLEKCRWYLDRLIGIKKKGGK